MTRRALRADALPIAAQPAAATSTAAQGEFLAQPLRHELEHRFGARLGAVRLHRGPAAARQASSLGASAYTQGSDIVLGAGWQPATPAGERLLLHEVAHAVQRARGQTAAGVAYRQPIGMSSDDADLAAEREYGDKGAPKAQTCGRPAHCPPGFCDPYRSEDLAKYYRAKNGGWLMLGISAAVDSRVVPLWREYLDGGSPPKNLTANFGVDFTNSPTTAKTTKFVRKTLADALATSPPSVPLYSMKVVDIAAAVPGAAAAINDAASPDQMNFNIPKDIPGNLAGGLGKDQTSCPSGAQPSPFNDERVLGGKATLWRLSAQKFQVFPSISYTVRDTIDLCPGDCGTKLESVATVPLSQFEATGISGDVPFTVEFPSPDNSSFDVAAPLAVTGAGSNAP